VVADVLADDIMVDIGVTATKNITMMADVMVADVMVADIMMDIVVTATKNITMMMTSVLSMFFHRSLSKSLVDLPL
jgi:hypothetical protein